MFLGRFNQDLAMYNGREWRKKKEEMDGKS